MKPLSHQADLVLPTPSRAGFTLTEILISIMILGIVMAGSMSALIYILRSETQLTMQTQMNAEAQRALTLIRNAARLTSFDEMLFYPSNSIPYAISFPVPGTTNGTDIVLDSSGRAAWIETFMIHPWPHTNPSELRFTRFASRNNALSMAQRWADLESVVLNGNALNATGDSNATTRTIARLGTDFTLNTEGRLYDFYNSSPIRDSTASLGGVRIQPGANTIRFTAVDQHSASSGFGLRLDQLRVSPAGLTIEAEALMPASSQSGASAVIQESVASSWSDRRWIHFPGSAVNHHLELSFYNDTWHETLFLVPGNQLSNSVTYVNTVSGQVGTRLIPDGRDLAWAATLQTSTSGMGLTTNLLMGAAVRVLVRGADTTHGDQILAKGQGCRVTFRSTDQLSWWSGLYITDAFISEAADHTNPGMDIDGTTTQRLRFGTPSSPNNWAWLPSGSVAQSVPTPFPIDPLKSYVVSYRLYGPWFTYQFGVPMSWPVATNRFETFYIPGSSNPTVADTTAANWSSRSDIVPYSAVLGVQEINTTYVSNALFTSRIVDTRIDQPDYGTLNWTATTPAGTSLQMFMRSFNQPNGSDASNWTAINAPGNVPSGAGNGRYVQIMSRLQPNTVQNTAPELHHFTLQWLGEDTYMDIGGTFGRYPGGGVMEVRVNEESPAASIRAGVSLGGTPFSGSPLSWSIGMEVAPRNR